METSESKEGWYTDPFGRHEARWLSDGIPTKLVRDGEEESYDDPPDEEPSVTPTRIEDHPQTHGEDLLRADDDVPNHESLNEQMEEAAEFGMTERAAD